ncbi:hypothetical protein H0H92_014416, partial [Tricholoma furcatifolium]
MPLASGSTGPQRPYELIDLMSLKRADLVELVNMQRDCWPEDVPFNLHTNKQQLRNALFNRSHGFSTTLPRAPHQPEWNNDFDPYADILAQLRDSAPPPAPQLEHQPLAFPPPPSDNGQVLQRGLHVYIEDEQYTPKSMSSVDIVVDIQGIIDANPAVVENIETLIESAL